jgi:hypothetical protein
MQCHRPVPDMIGAGPDHGRILGTIDAAVDDVGLDPRDMQTLGLPAIDEDDLDDRRHLPQQPQYVEAVPLVSAFPPRQLHGPLQLVGNIVEKSLDLAGGRARLCAQPLRQHHTLIAIAKPRLAGPIGQQRHHNRYEQCDAIFLE